MLITRPLRSDEFLKQRSDRRRGAQPGDQTPIFLACWPATDVEVVIRIDYTASGTLDLPRLSSAPFSPSEERTRLRAN